jgi:hypothetical protein
MSGMYKFTREDTDVEDLRRRLAKMTDEELLQYGKSAAFMAGRSSRETWKIQLAECRAEWRRRHPKT